MDIYDLLVDIIKKDGYKTIRGDFSDSNKERLQTQSEKDIFELIKNICSMCVKYEKDVATFYPAMIWYDEGTRSYGPQDLRDEDYDKLEKLDIEKLPTVLAVRIADLLWTYRNRYKMAEKAIDLYRKIFVEQFDTNRWTKCVEAIKRSLVLSAKINKQELLKKDCECIYEKICELNGDDPLYLSISLLDILYEFKGEEIDTLIEKIDVVISKTNNIDKLIRAYGLKIKCLIRKKDADSEKNTKMELAEIYINEADKLGRKNVQEVFEAEKYYREAVFIYRGIGEKVKAELAHKKMLEVQQEIHKYMIPLVGEEGLRENYVRENYMRVEKLFENLSLKEHILMIAQCIQLYDKEDLKKRVIEESVNPINSLFGMGYKDEKGRTIIDIPALDINNPTGNIEVLELHMHSIAKLIEEISGNTYLKWSIDLLNKNHKYEKNDLKFLVENNPIIPVGRANIILSAIYYGLKDDSEISQCKLKRNVDERQHHIIKSAKIYIYCRFGI